MPVYDSRTDKISHGHWRFGFYRLSHARLWAQTACLTVSIVLGGVIISGCKPDPSPEIAVAWPTNDFKATNSSLNVSGVAFAGGSMAEVFWTNKNNGAHGAASIIDEKKNWHADGVKLAAGTNDITFIVTNAAGVSSTSSLSVAYAAAPEIKFTSPTNASRYLTHVNNIAISGSPGSSNGITGIEWFNSQGGKGDGAVSATDWKLGPVRLYSGDNEIAVTAKTRDAAASKTLTVTYDPNISPPVLAIDCPPANKNGEYFTTNGRVEVKGIALSQIKITNMVWSINGGKLHKAIGATDNWTNWSTGTNELAPGPNRVKITAKNLAGASGEAQLLVYYTPIRAQAPTVKITSPVQKVVFLPVPASPVLAIGGDATFGRGAQMTWRANGGPAHAITPRTNWDTLVAATELFTRVVVTIKDDSGKSAESVLDIWRRARPNMANDFSENRSDNSTGSYTVEPNIKAADDAAKAEIAARDSLAGQEAQNDDFVAKLDALKRDVAGDQNTEAKDEKELAQLNDNVAKADMANYTAGVASAQAQYDVALATETNAEHEAQLAANEAASRNEAWTNAEARLANAKANPPGGNVQAATDEEATVESDKEALDKAKTAQDSAEQTLEKTKAKLAQAETLLAKAKHDLSAAETGNKNSKARISWLQKEIEATAKNLQEDQNKSRALEENRADLKKNEDATKKTIADSENSIAASMSAAESDLRSMACSAQASADQARKNYEASVTNAVEGALSKLQDALDNAQDNVDEWGTITVSSPIFNYARSNEFLFGLSNGAPFYFNDAKTNTQGQAALFTQASANLAQGISAQVDPTQTAAYMNATRNFLQQQSAYQLQQESMRQAANAQLQGLLQQAATNTNTGAANLARSSAFSNYSQLVYGTNGPPVFPTASAFNSNLPNLPTNLLPSTNSTPLLTNRDFLGLLSSLPGGLSIEDRSAIITAAGDNAIEAFFRALGNSSLYSNFINSELYFGLTTVSVNPGWRTKTDWAGEVSVSADFDFQVARRETILRVLNNPLWPANVRARVAADYGYPYNDPEQMRAMGVVRAREIAAAIPATNINEAATILLGSRHKTAQMMVISPLIESQTFDMAESEREQIQLSLYLAVALNYAGASGAAQAFHQFAKSRQQDFATRTPIAMVNAFSGEDGSYGFQIGPRFQALTLGKKLKGPQNVLERQSFPALVLMSMSKGDIEPRVTLDVKENAFRVYEPYVTLHQTPRWVPLKHFRFVHNDWFKPYTWHVPTLMESDRSDAAKQLEAGREEVINALTPYDTNGASVETNLGPYYLVYGTNSHRRLVIPDAVQKMTNVLFSRVDFYKRQLLGSVDEVKLPYDHMVPDVVVEDASVTNIVPNFFKLRFTAEGDLDPLPATFVLQGRNLDSVAQPIAAYFTNAVNIQVLAQSQDALAIQTTVTNADPLIFELPSKRDPSAAPLLAPPVRVLDSRIFPQVLDTEPKFVQLHRDPGNNPIATNIDIVMVGKGLSRVDVANADLISGAATLNSPVQLLGDGLKASVTVTNISPIVVRLPIPPVVPEAPSNYIYSWSVPVGIDPANPPPPKPTNGPTLEVNKVLSMTTVTVATNATPDQTQAAAVAAAAAQGVTNTNAIAH